MTCSQRQWLHSSVGRASHRYREVTGSNPVEVLNFFQASLRNCLNCVSLRRSYLHFISCPQFIYDSYMKRGLSVTVQWPLQDNCNVQLNRKSTYKYCISTWNCRSSHVLKSFSYATSIKSLHTTIFHLRI